MTRSTDADERMAGQTLVSQFGLGCLFWQDPSGELWERAEDEGIWNPLTLEALDENIRAIASEFEMADLEEAVRRVRKILLRTATRPQSLRKTPVPTIMDIDRRPIDFLAALQANRAKA